MIGKGYLLPSIIVGLLLVAAIQVVFIASPSKVEAARVQGSSLTFVADSTCLPDSGCAKLYAKYLNPLIKLLSAVVGIAAVLMVVVGGVQYSAAGSDPQKISAAKKMITNALLGVAAYALLLTFLNWIIPGGIG